MAPHAPGRGGWSGGGAGIFKQYVIFLAAWHWGERVTAVAIKNQSAVTMAVTVVSRSKFVCLFVCLLWAIY
jgi:hypothetical protein